MAIMHNTIFIFFYNIIKQIMLPVYVVTINKALETVLKSA